MAPHLINWIGFLTHPLSAIVEQLNATSVLPVGPNFLERVGALPASIQEVVTHGLRHGATLAMAVAQLCSDADLRAVEPGFLPELPIYEI